MPLKLPTSLMLSGGEYGRELVCSASVLTPVLVECVSSVYKFEAYTCWKLLAVTLTGSADDDNSVLEAGEPGRFSVLAGVSLTNIKLTGVDTTSSVDVPSIMFSLMPKKLLVDSREEAVV